MHERSRIVVFDRRLELARRARLSDPPRACATTRHGASVHRTTRDLGNAKLARGNRLCVVARDQALTHRGICTHRNQTFDMAILLPLGEHAEGCSKWNVICCCLGIGAAGIARAGSGASRPRCIRILTSRWKQACERFGRLALRASARRHEVVSGRAPSAILRAIRLVSNERRNGTCAPLITLGIAASGHRRCEHMHGCDTSFRLCA
mmetsp:Transcript_9993/g.26785  ORF Transcript_9993/g.26785 Transcript_9993/m.26785 type:complete len:207 (+) Transcript_9993:84-704(+)